MKEQEQHQIKPPGAADVDLHEREGLGHQKLGQDMIGLVGHCSGLKVWNAILDHDEQSTTIPQFKKTYNICREFS